MSTGSTGRRMTFRCASSDQGDRGSRRHGDFALAALGLLAASACASLIWLWAEVRLFHAIPILCLVAIGYCLVRDRRDPLLLLAAFSLAFGLRVVLQYHPLWYGFCLVVPGYVFAVYALGERVARRLPGRAAVVTALACLALHMMSRFESKMWRAYGERSSVLVTSKGEIRDAPTGRLRVIGEFLDYAQSGWEAETLVVLPEGVSLNYFTGIRNPTAYYLFTPAEITSETVENRMIDELDAAKPDYLVLTSRDVSEYGRQGIGLDYALSLGDWIRATYDLERVFEAAGDRPWRLVLLRRREASGSQLQGMGL